jgi:hypothetical protein
MTRDDAEEALSGLAQVLARGGTLAPDVGSWVVEAVGVLSTSLDHIMGAKDAAAMLGVQVPNLKQTGLQPVTRISGGTIPVYLRDDVERVRQEREERASRRAAASE